MRIVAGAFGRTDNSGQVTTFFRCAVSWHFSGSRAGWSPVARLDLLLPKRRHNSGTWRNCKYLFSASGTQPDQICDFAGSNTLGQECFCLTKQLIPHLVRTADYSSDVLETDHLWLSNPSWIGRSLCDSRSLVPREPRIGFNSPWESPLASIPRRHPAVDAPCNDDVYHGTGFMGTTP